MQRVTFGLVCLSLLCLSATVHAQSAADSPIPDTPAGALEDFSGGTMLDTGGLLGGTYIDVRHVIGDGIGYRNSYSQIGGFLPVWITEDSFLAPNARFILTNSTQTGVNVGLVGRQYFEQMDRLIGVYGYYDNDQNYRNFRYQQYTVGAETLGTWWDLRANGYFINGNQSNFVQEISLSGDPYYVGHQLALQGRDLRDRALGGADIELGVPLSPKTPWLRGFGGVYGYRHDDTNTVGYRGRVEATVASDLSLGMQWSHDNLFGTNLNGTIEFKFSGFKPTLYFPQLTTRQRMTTSVQRNWRIATNSYIDTVNVATLDPTTKQPYFITHVTAGAPAGGDGTFEHPFSALPNSAPGQIILVHNGTSSFANPTGGNITLSDNQRLLGDGFPSLVFLEAHHGVSNLIGNYQLPGTSSSNPYPFVGGGAGNTVTLANNNEVAGLSFVKAGGSAITNNALTGSRNFLLHDINVNQNGAYGINLQNATGLGIVSNVNSAPGPGFLNYNGQLGDNASGGVQIAAGLSGLNLFMSDVYMNASAQTNQAFGVSLAANAGDLTVFMNNVSANNNITGIRLSETNRNLTAIMNVNPNGTDNLNTTVSANFNQLAGFDITGTGGAINFRGSTLTALSNGSDNFRFVTQNTKSDTGISNSFFSGSLLGSGVLHTQDGGIGNLSLVNVESNANKINGVGVFGSNGSKTNAYVLNSVVVNNNVDGVHNEAITGANINMIIDPTNVSANGRDGYYFRASGVNSFINASLADVTLDANRRNAIHGEVLNGAGVALNAAVFSGQNSGADGFYLNATGGSSALIRMTNGSFNNSGVNSAGMAAMNININQSVVNMYTSDVTGQQTIAGNQSFGLKLDVLNSGFYNGTIRNGNFSNTTSDAINIDLTNGSAAQLQLAGTHADNSGRDGMHVTVNDIASQAYLSMVDGADINGIRHTTFDGNEHNGLFFDVAGRIDVTAQNASFSNNGQSGLDGSGVLGSVHGGALANLTFAGTTIDHNMDNGVALVATGASNVNAQFIGGSVSDNGATQPGQPLTARGNYGIALSLDTATNSFLGISGGTDISRNANDGLFIVTSSTSFLNSIIDGALFQDNGQTSNIASPLFSGNGINILNRQNSVVLMNLNDVTSGNVLPNTTQQSGLDVTTRTNAFTYIGATNVTMTNNVTGFLANTLLGGQMIADFDGGNLSANSADAVNSTVDGATSAAEINFFGTVANNSGNIGAIFNTTGGALQNVNANSSTTFSNSGGAGIFSNVAGANSQANFGLTNFQLLNNGVGGFGGQGLVGIVTGGANMNAAIFNSAISADSLQGMQLTVDGANSIANFHVEGTVVDSNSSEGLLITATNGAAVNYRSVNTSYNSNGSNGGLDGVKISSDNSKVLSLFSGGSIDANAGNGLNLILANNGTLTTSINNVSISNNAGYGIKTDTSAAGAGSNFNLLMSGTNPMTGNGLGNFSPFAFVNMNQAVIALTGSSNNSAGDGFSASFNGVTNAAFALVGPGTADGNAGRGVNVSMNNVVNGSVFVDGMTSISHNGLEGVLVNMTGVQHGSVNVIGQTTLDGNGAQGVNVNLTNSILEPNNPVGLAPIEVLTLVDDLATPPFPLSNQLPKPVITSLNALGIVPDTAMTIQQLTVLNSGAQGIRLNLQNSTVQVDGSGHSVLVSGNQVTNSTGDGILFNVFDSSAVGTQFLGNSSSVNSGNGLNIVSGSSNALVPSHLENMVIDKGVVSVNTGLDFTIIGDTFGAGTGVFNLINTSGTLSENVTGFTLNTATSVANVIFNTETGAFTPFTPFNNTDVATGLVSVNGTPVPVAGVDPYPPSLVPDFSQLLDLVFNNFAPGENFQWDNDFDLTPGGDEPVSGDQLIGSQITVNFTGGYTLTGALVALPGDPTSSHFVATGGNTGASNFQNNANDGIRFSLNNTNIDNLSVKNTSITSNGTGGVGHGIEFTGSGGAVANSTLNNVVLDANTISLNAGDGVRLVNPLTTNSTINMTVSNNTIGQNIGNGVNLNLVAGAQNLRAPFTGNTINGNTNGSGVNIQMGVNGSVLAGSNFTNNTINSNSQRGVNFVMANGGSVSGNFTGNTINSNIQEGVRYAMGANNGANLANINANYTNNTVNSNGAQGLNFLMGPAIPNPLSAYGTMTSQFIGNTINQNVGEGINITLAQGVIAGAGADFVGNNFYGNTISNNGSLGVRLTSNDQGSFAWNWNTTGSAQPANVISGNQNAGVGVRMNGNSTGTLNIVNSTFSNNVVGSDGQFAGQGLNVTQTGSSVLTGSITGSRFTGNAGDGAFFSVTGNNVGTFAILQNFTIGGATSTLGNSFTSNGANGLNFLRTADGEITNVTVQHNTLNSNALNGMLATSGNKAFVDSYTINDNDMSSNGVDGLRLFVQADAQIQANMTRNTFTNNGANGIHTLEQTNFATDLRRISGTWTLNTVTDNGTNGIFLDAAMNGLLIGDLTNTSVGNLIANNAGSGILVTGPGSLTVGSNIIQENGTLANLGTANENAGILMSVRPTSNITVTNNLIADNFGDGIQYGMSTNFFGNFNNTIAITNNLDINNRGRGIDLINQGSTNTDADISGNIVSGNRLEGVYIVNTASTTQNQFSASTDPLAADGAVFDALGGPRLQLHMVGNQITGNGLSSGLQGTGLVIRVGTSDGRDGPGAQSDTGGFASTGVSGAVITQGASAATFFANVNSTRGGVVAQIDNNTLGGNNGNDLEFHSFVSTVPPITAAGTWVIPPVLPADPPSQTITAYQSDPLSRFDLYFRGNTTDPGALDSLGVALQGYATRNPLLAAFYNDADGVFKSRLDTILPGTNAGPFTSATRARNATRQAAFNPAVPADGSNVLNVLYPGMGASTWRASLNSSAALTGQASALAGSIFGELPYVWGSF